MFSCADTIFKIHLSYFLKDRSFKCILPFLLDGSTSFFNRNIPVKCMRSSQNYKELLETLAETGRSFNGLYPSLCRDFSAQNSFTKHGRLGVTQCYEAVHPLVIGN